MLNDITVFNIREYLSDKDDKILGEEMLQQILSEFSCEKNSDVEKFLKGKSIEFTKKNQSVTYLVFSNEDAALVGYFTLTIKPIVVKADSFSNTMKRKIARVSELDVTHGTYTLSAIKELQYMAGGMVIFLEAEDNEKLMEFYEGQNGFRKFATKDTKNEAEDSHVLIQLLKVM